MITFASVLKNKIVNQGYLGICVAERQLPPPPKSSLTTDSEINSEAAVKVFTSQFILV